MIAVSLLAFAALASLRGTDAVPFLGGSFGDRATAGRPSRPSRQSRPDQLAQLPPSLGDQGLAGGGFGGDGPVNQGFGNQGFGGDDDVFVFDRPTPGRPRPRPTPPWQTTRVTRTPQSPPTQAASGGSTTANICVSSCPTTGEFNPVCGTDRVTYTNPGKLNCASSCGRSVNLSHYGTCPTTTPPTTTASSRP